MNPGDLLTEHFRLVPDQKKALHRLKVATIHDLLYHFPVRYDNIQESGTVASLAHGTTVTLYGKLSRLTAKKLWKSRRTATEGWFEDGSGRIKVIWFNQPYISKMVPENVVVKLSGTVAGKEKPYITNPEIEVVAGNAIADGLFRTEENSEAVLFPVYPESQGITSRWMYHALKKILAERFVQELEDPIPSEVRDTYHLPDLPSALIRVHLPKTVRDAEASRKRFSFEEMFVLQIGKQIERKRNTELPAFRVQADPGRVEQFTASLPFPLTGAQQRVIGDILTDFEKPHPMARLLEGDVGSGKTVVAAATAYAVVTSRPKGRISGTLQVAYMAPTEILAGQHFLSFIEFYRHLPINIALLTGSGCFKFPSKINREKPTAISRAQLLKWVANGEIAMLIGTHALIQKSIKFAHLAYAIVDEQHRFGTAQRQKLAHKGDAPPHFLSMSATPMPRTLALTMYGDLDISVLDELPKDRAGIETRLVPKEKRSEAYSIMRRELSLGRQVYVICPRIDEPDPEKEMALRARSVVAEAKRLKKEVFPEYTIGVLHGKMTPADKDSIMKLFSNGTIHILVATSVVEVGVNVPNATIIMIEGAERFGLAQLHQLRGRVLRSAHTAYCFLAPESLSETSRNRLKAIAKTRDGFALAEQDLLLRGAGDLYGRSQWGISDLGMEALKNPKLIEAAREAARYLVEKDAVLPNLIERAERTGALLHEE
ncbi:MAG: ATP-dependent DNA helicase RecG [Patescibacteria group bacterium]